MIFVKVSSKVFMIEFASSDWLDDNVDDSSPFIRIALESLHNDPCISYCW